MPKVNSNTRKSFTKKSDVSSESSGTRTRKRCECCGDGTIKPNDYLRIERAKKALKKKQRTEGSCDSQSVQSNRDDCESIQAQSVGCSQEDIGHEQETPRSNQLRKIEEENSPPTSSQIKEHLLSIRIGESRYVRKYNSAQEFQQALERVKQMI